MIKNFLKKMSDLASSINGKEVDTSVESQPTPQPTPQPTLLLDSEPDTEPVSGLVSDPDPEPVSEPDPEPAQSSSILNNAIDNRDSAVRKIVDSFRPAIGTSSRDFETLVVYVVYTEKPYDPLLHAWADDKFVDSLRRALDNALLSAVGAENIILTPLHIDNSDLQSAKEIVPDTIYVTWRSNKKEMKTDVVCRAKISLVVDTGSLAQPVYYLSTDAKAKYTIGRGKVSRRDNHLRQNDIVINGNDPDPEINELNMRVSSAHADIIVRSGRFYLKAADGGCRSRGGSPTKLIRCEDVIELSDTSAMLPLQDGDIIELGKTVCLLFNII